MAGPLTILLGVLAGLGVGLAVFKTGSGSSILKKIHEIFQKQKVDEIVNIEGKQNVVRTEIATKEKITKDSQKKIRDIQEKAASEIEEVLKEENVSNIHKTITSDWEDI